MAIKTLKKARQRKADEFYTMFKDVEIELINYSFDGKVVYCPCDNPNISNFTKYFRDNFEKLGIKRLISTCYPQGIMEVVDNKGTRTFKLKGDGDFRSEECIRILKNCDVVVTNPPFSLFREFMRIVFENKKMFIVIGNKNAITYKDVFPYIKDNKIWLGYTSPSKFIQPESDEMKNVTGLTRWFTNLEIPKRTEKFDTRIEFENGNAKGWYQKFDNYDAINVNESKQIPMDYDGLMGVPITFLDKYNPEQFDIIGIFNRYSSSDYEKGLICGDEKEYVDNHGKILKTRGPILNKKTLYTRLLIKRKV